MDFYESVRKESGTVKCRQWYNIKEEIKENLMLWLHLSDSGYVSVNNIVKKVMTTQVPYSTDNS